MSDGTNANLDDELIKFNEFNKLIGLQEIKELEKIFLTKIEIENKYGSTETEEKEKYSKKD
jgi:hypothetical protein